MNPEPMSITLVGEGPVARRVYGLLRERGARVQAVARYDEYTPASDVVVECVGGVSPAFAVVMAALGRGIAAVTANSLLMAVHGQVLAAASAGQQAPLGFGAALGAARPLLGWLQAEAPRKVTVALNSGANAVLQRMERRGEVAADAEQHLAQAGHELRDVSGKHTLALGVTLAGAMSGRWAKAGGMARMGLEQIALADWARLARFGLRLCYGAEVESGQVRAGLLAVRQGALLQCFDQDVVVAETAYGAEMVMTAAAVDDEMTAQALVAEALSVKRRKPLAYLPASEATVAGQRRYMVRVPYAQREVLLVAGFSPEQEHVDSAGVWCAVGTMEVAPVVGEGLCIPVSGTWAPVQAGLRLVG